MRCRAHQRVAQTRSIRQVRIITRKGDFHQVMSGIDEASRAGLKIKINTVALRDVNEAELEIFAVGRMGAASISL